MREFSFMEILLLNENSSESYNTWQLSFAKHFGILQWSFTILTDSHRAREPWASGIRTVYCKTLWQALGLTVLYVCPWPSAPILGFLGMALWVSYYSTYVVRGKLSYLLTYVRTCTYVMQALFRGSETIQGEAPLIVPSPQSTSNILRSRRRRRGTLSGRWTWYVSVGTYTT